MKEENLAKVPMMTVDGVEVKTGLTLYKPIYFSGWGERKPQIERSTVIYVSLKSRSFRTRGPHGETIHGYTLNASREAIYGTLKAARQHLKDCISADIKRSRDSMKSSYERVQALIKCEREVTRLK